jgi:hypothetical protein
MATEVELLKAKIAELEAAAAKSNGPIGFAKSEKNDKFWTFKHGTRGAWPVSTTPEAWKVIIANVDLIKRSLKV